ncbi:MAG: efflux RND transporter periplasmic adaptor subunit [Pseudomonadota bacterium]
MSKTTSKASASDSTLGKQFLLLGLFAGLAYGGYLAWQEYRPAEDAFTPRQSSAVTVELARATTQVMAQTVEAVGTSRARQSVQIVPEDDGRVVELMIAPGQPVGRGDVLVRLDDNIERADLAEARARVIEREQALTRVEQLIGSAAVSLATLEDTTARLAEARAQLDRAEQRFANRTITAPFSGIVGLSEIDPGAWIEEGEMITTLDDLSDVEVEFSLPETLFSDVKIGQQIAARSAAFPGQSFAGQIAALDSRIDPVSRSFRARAIIPNPDSVLPAGMFMSLTVTLSERQRVVVPEEAIVFQAAETYVFLADEGKANRLRVSTGQRRGGVVAITQGLEEGAEVIISGLTRVTDGKAIRVLDGPTEATTAADGDT